MPEVFTSRLSETRGQADRAILQPDSASSHAPVSRSYRISEAKLYLAGIVVAIGAGLAVHRPCRDTAARLLECDEIKYATGNAVPACSARSK